MESPTKHVVIIVRIFKNHSFKQQKFKKCDYELIINSILSVNWAISNCWKEIVKSLRWDYLCRLRIIRIKVIRLQWIASFAKGAWVGFQHNHVASFELAFVIHKSAWLSRSKRKLVRFIFLWNLQIFPNEFFFGRHLLLLLYLALIYLKRIPNQLISDLLDL